MNAYGQMISLGAEVRWYSYASGWRFGKVIALLRGHYGEGADGVMVKGREGTTTMLLVYVELCGQWPKGVM